MKDNILSDSVNSTLGKSTEVLTGFMHAAREQPMSETLRSKGGKIRKGKLQHLSCF
jgi:hypothetical protein